MIKVRGNVISLIAGAGMVVLYFAVILPGEGLVPSSALTVVVYWVIIGALIAFPVAGFLSERFVPGPFKATGEKAGSDYSKARSLVEQGRFEEAIEEYRQGLIKDPKNVSVRLEVAEIYSRHMKDFPRAISELEECLELRLEAVQGASALNRMADIYETNLDGLEAALAALRKIGERWPGSKAADRAEERIRRIKERLGGG